MKTIVDERQVWIKEEIKIISSSNASQKLFVYEVLKLVKLILLVPTTNVNIKTCLRSSIVQEPLCSFLIVTTCKKRVDKLKLLKAASQFCFKNKNRFFFKSRYFPRNFTGSPAKGTQTSNQRYSSVETWHFMVYINIYMIHMMYIIYIYIYMNKCISIHTYMLYIYIYININININIYIYICMYIYIY